MSRRVCQGVVAVLDIVLVVGLLPALILTVIGAMDLHYVAQHPYQDADVENAAQHALDHCLGDPCLHSAVNGSCEEWADVFRHAPSELYGRYCATYCSLNVGCTVHDRARCGPSCEDVWRNYDNVVRHLGTNQTERQKQGAWFCSSFALLAAVGCLRSCVSEELKSRRPLPLVWPILVVKNEGVGRERPPSPQGGLTVMEGPVMDEGVGRERPHSPPGGLVVTDEGSTHVGD